MNDAILAFIAFVLFLGGIFILALKIPFWSLLLGVASIQIGIVMLIFSFDYYFRKKGKRITDSFKTVACLMCHRVVYVPRFYRFAICDDCQVKVAQTLKATVLTIFGIISITSVVLLASQNQDIRRKASVPLPTVVPESWNPVECGQGNWEESGSASCVSPSGIRTCGGQVYCCTAEENKHGWICNKADSDSTLRH